MKVILYLSFILFFGASLSGCGEQSETESVQPALTNDTNAKTQPLVQEQPEVVPEKPKPKPEPKQVSVVQPKKADKTEIPKPKPVEVKVRKPVDMSLDDDTVKTIRLDVPAIVDRPMEMPDLFGKYEKQVKIKSRVLVKEDGQKSDMVDGAEINLEMKVK